MKKIALLITTIVLLVCVEFTKNSTAINTHSTLIPIDNSCAMRCSLKHNQCLQYCGGKDYISQNCVDRCGIEYHYCLNSCERGER